MDKYTSRKGLDDCGDQKCGEMALPSGCSECRGWQPLPSLLCLVGGGGLGGLAASLLAVLEGKYS